MRRTEYLITEVRNSTDSLAANAVKDAEIIGYLNYGQKLIQNIIFKVNPKADIFKKKVSYSYAASGEYALPDDIFAQNSISLVEYKDGENYFPIDRIDEREKCSGYYTEDKNLIVVGYDNFDIRVTCFRALPRMDKRWGKVASVIANTSITMSVGFDANASTVDDYISTVNKYGAQVVGDVFIDLYTAGVWSCALTAGVVANDYVCMGKNSVNASELPDECEPFLLDYARQRIYTRSNYEDASKQVYFTDSQRADIADLFKDNQKDSLFPPITEPMDF